MHRLLKQYIPLLLIIIFSTSCSNQNKPVIEKVYNTTSPFLYNAKGKIKKVRKYECLDFSYDIDSASLYSTKWCFDYQELIFDESGNLSRQVDSILGIGVKYTMDRTNNILTAWQEISFKTGDTIEQTYIEHIADTLSYAHTIATKTGDTIIMQHYHYDPQNRLIKYQRDFIATGSEDQDTPKKGLTYSHNKTFTYNDQDELQSISYSGHNQAKGPTTLTVLERDTQGNPTLIQQTMKDEKGKNKYGAIKMEYEYFN